MTAPIAGAPTDLASALDRITELEVALAAAEGRRSEVADQAFDAGFSAGFAAAQTSRCR